LSIREKKLNIELVPSPFGLRLKGVISSLLSWNGSKGVIGMNDWRMYTDASGQEVESVGWARVLKEIAQLNGTTHTLVHAAYGEHVDLVVAGGNNGKVLVQWKEHEPVEKHFVLASAQPDGVMCNLNIEGAEVAFPFAWCISLEQAVPICGDTLRTCEMAQYPGLTWVAVEM